MEQLNNFEVIAIGVLTIWSIGLGVASWRVHLMARELGQERAELRRWVRIKGLGERQARRWR